MEENTATLPDGTELLESEMTQEQLVLQKIILIFLTKI